MRNVSEYGFQDFIEDLELITGQYGPGPDLIRRIVRRMEILLRGGDRFLTVAEKEGRKDHYARHLMHVDRNRNFIVASLVWEPGQGTPIHDHWTWGVAGVVDGKLRVEAFLRTDDRKTPGVAELQESDARWLGPGEIGYVLPPNEEVHRMSNPTAQKTISLHVYGREIVECNKYDPENRRYELWRLTHENAARVER